jgi:hypothetical protein
VYDGIGVLEVRSVGRGFEDVASCPCDGLGPLGRIGGGCDCRPGGFTGAAVRIRYGSRRLRDSAT